MRNIVHVLLFLVVSAPPEKITVVAESSTSLIISWQDVPKEHRKSEIIGYHIVLRDVLANYSEELLINTSHSCQITNLEKYYKYSFRIAARSSLGIGVYSPWISQMTKEDSEEILFCLFHLVAAAFIAVVVVFVVFVGVVVLAAFVSVVYCCCCCNCCCCCGC